jgi:hypothetical protein
VQLAERPLAERDPRTLPDDPGLEETIWVERLSPCHGIVRCALYEPLGVDYGDVVLFDGAPVTYHKYADTTVPVFPHLATLERRKYRILEFAGTQCEKEQIANLSAMLPDDTVLYVHTEQVVMLCAECFRNTDLDHGRHESSEHTIVTGKLCAPPEIAPAELLRALDAAVQSAPGVSVYVPELANAAGNERRARIEARRYAMMIGAP